MSIVSTGRMYGTYPILIPFLSPTHLPLECLLRHAAVAIGLVALPVLSSAQPNCTTSEVPYATQRKPRHDIVAVNKGSDQAGRSSFGTKPRGDETWRSKAVCRDTPAYRKARCFVGKAGLGRRPHLNGSGERQGQHKEGVHSPVRGGQPPQHQDYARKEQAL